jgi:hypothetical protein
LGKATTRLGVDVAVTVGTARGTNVSVGMTIGVEALEGGESGVNGERGVVVPTGRLQNVKIKSAAIHKFLLIHPPSLDKS